MPGKTPNSRTTGRLEAPLSRPASPRTIDFSVCREVYLMRDDKGLMRNVNVHGFLMDKPGTITTASVHYAEVPMNGQPHRNLSATRNQKLKRLRRRSRKAIRLADAAWNETYKPIEQWDLAELAHGRPRNGAGDFRGRPPAYITKELHERILERFQTMVRQGMNEQTIDALGVISVILASEETDHRGKPIVPYGTKLDAAKFLLEHVVGKPVQPSTSDISVKLQGILGSVMVTPDQVPASYQLAHMGSRGEIESGNTIDADIVEDEDG